jgi:hypothetical protein
MSREAIIIYCDACDITGSDSGGRDYFVYRFADASEVYAPQAMGWCGACTKIRVIEHLPALSKIEGSTAEHQRKILEIPKKRFWQSGRKARETERYHVDQLHVLALWHRLLTERMSAPRCLTCGSTDVAALDLYGKKLGNYDFPLTMQHPGCGGTFHAKRSSYRFNFSRFGKIVLNPEGSVIEKVEVPA